MEIARLSGKREAIIFILLLTFCQNLIAQEVQYNWFYRIYFTDKGENAVYSYLPEDLLSDRALARRVKESIPSVDISDIPVSSDYINTITAKGLKLHCTSKWMNTALFKSTNAIDISLIQDLPFIKEIKIVKHPVKGTLFSNKLDFETSVSETVPYNLPLTMLKGNLIHSSGFNGKNVLIAILDGGFLSGNQINSINSLRNRKGILATRDFVSNSDNVYTSSLHGTAVLSVLAGFIPGYIEGTAPGAEYLLLRTEDVDSEFPCEEDMWIAGAEYADSCGADIISSSLGYSTFDDPALNYKYSDLDGKSAFITRGAELASAKGILVVNSAGNERNKAWQKIISPADGLNILAAGAVDPSKRIADFSSVGPSYDGRTKPDLSAMGVSVTVQTTTVGFWLASGTSFSCPVLSGMAACLLQAVPLTKRNDLLLALQQSGDKYNSPDSLYGYGIPDMTKALTFLQDKYILIPEIQVIASPNPTRGETELTFRQAPGSFTIEIISASGKTFFRKDCPDWTGRTMRLPETAGLDQGIYLIRIKKSSGTDVLKIIKLNN